MALIRYGKACIWLALLLLALHGFSVHAQDLAEADSLIAVLSALNVADDSSRFELLKRIAYRHPDPAQSLAYAEVTLALAKNMNDRVRIARAQEEICLSQRVLGNKIESFKAAFEALRIYDSLKMQKRQAAMYVQIGSNYTLEKEYEKAIDFLTSGVRIYETLENDNGMTLAEINLGETYRLAGRMDSAAWYFKKVLRGNKAARDAQTRGYALGNLGMVYASQDKHDEAQHALAEAIKILDTLGDVYSVSVYTSELGLVYKKLGKREKCIALLQRALTLAKQNNLKEQIRDIGFMLYRFYEENKQFDKALYFHRLYKDYQDSLINLENVKAIEQINSKYEFEKKDKEIAEQRIEIRKNAYERNIVVLVAVFLVVIIITSILAYLRKQKDNKLLAYQKNEIAAREEQKNWLLGELQHRTKNNLQMISSLLSLQSRQLVGHPSYEAIRDGQSRVDALAVIHRRLYQEGSQLKINLHDYLMELIENLVYGFNKKVAIQADIDGFDLDVDKAIPLALIVNELVTNALKHAYTTTTRPLIIVRFEKGIDNMAQLEIVDNGKGMAEADAEKGDTFGFRLIWSLSAQLKASVQQVKVDQGCHWRVTFPTYVNG